MTTIIIDYVFSKKKLTITITIMNNIIDYNSDFKLIDFLSLV